MRDYPPMTDHTAAVEPVPRRIRGYVGGRLLFDTTAARYVWDTPKYPAYQIPTADVDLSLLQDDDRPRQHTDITVDGVLLERPEPVRG